MIEDKFRDLIREIVREVLVEVGQSETPQLYDIPTAAKILSLPERWFYEKTSHNAIPFRKIGKYVRFSASDLKQIAERK